MYTDWHAVCDCRCARAGGAWIRALSLKDPVEGATRPDHGKWGAYAAWPPLVAEAFAELSGEFEQTLMILRGAEGVARQGPFGQATQLRPSPTFTPRMLARTINNVRRVRRACGPLHARGSASR